jgi:hypothetical protein
MQPAGCTVDQSLRANSALLRHAMAETNRHVHPKYNKQMD